MRVRARRLSRQTRQKIREGKDAPEQKNEDEKAPAKKAPAKKAASSDG